VADALQYACMATQGTTARAIARKLRPRAQSSMATRRTAAGWT
jgi:hypothetical protein